MKSLPFYLFAAILIFGQVATSPLYAQYQEKESEVLQPAFVPLDRPHSTPYRSASGKPGPEYWQNEADYNIDVTLDTTDHTVSGHIEINYVNNSPDELNYVWIQLDQNRFGKDSRGTRSISHRGSRFDSRGRDGGYSISNVGIERHGDSYKPEWTMANTHMKLDLRKPLKSEGDSIAISMDFSFPVLEYGADRMGRLDTKNGWIYELAQWYPRMAVYDDLKGWNVRPYLGTGEFYLEFGEFNYSITVPANHIVGASGELLNPEDVLTDEQYERLQTAKNSEETVFIRRPEEVKKGDDRPDGGEDGMLTWEYRMENTRDIAWASSKSFIWDAASGTIKDRNILYSSIYPVESSGEKAWGRSTEYTKWSIEYYSDKWYPYPWNSAVNVAGVVGGMEYPGVSFCSWKAEEAGLMGVTDHEFGHNWFPMIVASNERLHMWMDEGLNTFMGHYSMSDFNDGEYGPWRPETRSLVSYLTKPNRQATMTLPDNVLSENRSQAFYYVPSIALRLLREEVIGEERFDRAFNTYIRRWAYKHPSPWDFFNTMENVAGADLDWFWRSWFIEAWEIDQAVDSVSYVDGQPDNGAIIQISNNKRMVMPVDLQVIEKNGKEHKLHLPVDIWREGNQWEEYVETESPVQRVHIDYKQVLPDSDTTNNIWKNPDLQKE